MRRASWSNGVRGALSVTPAPVGRPAHSRTSQSHAELDRTALFSLSMNASSVCREVRRRGSSSRSSTSLAIRQSVERDMLALIVLRLVVSPASTQRRRRAVRITSRRGSTFGSTASRHHTWRERVEGSIWRASPWTVSTGDPTNTIHNARPSWSGRLDHLANARARRCEGERVASAATIAGSSGSSGHVSLRSIERGSRRGKHPGRQPRRAPGPGPAAARHPPALRRLRGGSPRPPSGPPGSESHRGRTRPALAQAPNRLPREASAGAHRLRIRSSLGCRIPPRLDRLVCGADPADG